MSRIVTVAGFYGGKFLKPGASYDGPEDPHEVGPDLDAMTKDELLAEAERRGVTVKSGATKPEILETLKA